MANELSNITQLIKAQLFPLRKILVFILGALCFLVTQVFTRVPLLGRLQGNPDFMLLAMSYQLLSGVLVAFTAGLFEESGRFIIKALALKPIRTGISEPVIFGLGHGLCEAVWIFITYWGSISIIQPSQLILPVLERSFAITIHVGFSVMIWNGFQLDQRLRYLLMAIVTHGLVDALIPLAGTLGLGALGLEAIVAGIAGLLVIYIFYSRRYYKEEVFNE